MISKETKNKIITCVLTPLSWLYGTAVSIRNYFYDKHLIPTIGFDIPIVSVGNLAVGGTGKTPHVEYLINNLSADYNIAILSRGYKRKTRGYVLANTTSTPDTIGDESYQIYRKFGDTVKVAVCERRSDGIQQLLKDHPEINLIILDDAFQRRELRTNVSLLLTDYNRPYYNDKVLPLGRLREPIREASRADIIVVTKCKSDILPFDYRVIDGNLKKFSYQKAFFSRYEYGELKPVFDDVCSYSVSMSQLTGNDSVLLLTGIANPRSFIRHFKDYAVKKKVCHFPDHHSFTRRDLMYIEDAFNNMKGEHKIIITTEKDAVRLLANPYFPESLKKVVFYQPIKVRMLDGIDNCSDLAGYVKKQIEKKSPLK